MKYIVMDQIMNGDLFTEEFDTVDEAIETGEAEWEHLSRVDKNRRISFFVLESANPDVDAENHLDGNIVRRWK